MLVCDKQGYTPVEIPATALVNNDKKTRIHNQDRGSGLSLGTFSNLRKQENDHGSANPAGHVQWLGTLMRVYFEIS